MVKNAQVFLSSIVVVYDTSEGGGDNGGGDEGGDTPVITSGTGLYQLVTSADELSDGNIVLIVNQSSKVALGYKPSGSNRKAASITLSEDKKSISTTYATSSSDEEHAYQVQLVATDGGFYLFDIANQKYLNSGTGTSNNMYLVQNADASNGITTISINNTNQQATIKFNGDGNIKYLRCNTANNTGELFSCYANNKQQPVYLYKRVESISISSAGLATYASDNILSFTDVDGLEAYIAKDDKNTITLKQVQKVPAGTGILLRATDGGNKSYSVPVTAEMTDDMTGNLFVRGTGAAVATAGENSTNYILNIVDDVLGFYRAAGNTVATNRAYLQVPNGEGGETRAFIGINFDTNTGITNFEVSKVNGTAYDLQGRRVNEPKHGLYIINGKKMFIK